MRTVSIICACRNEKRSIESFLESLDAQLRPDFELEAIIADGASADGTRAVLDAFAERRPWVRIIKNDGRIASTGLNAAIRASHGDVILRMDAHTGYGEDYVAKCLAILELRNAAMVGGPVRIAPGSYWQNALALAYSSKVFSGGSQVYNVEYEGEVDSAPYGCWPRQILESAGLFDESMARNQDDELSYRIVKGGGAIWQSREIRFWYYPRRSAWALARQFFEYGYWKVYAMRKHRTVVRLRHIAPALAVALLGVLFCSASIDRSARFVLAICLLVYGVSVLAAGLFSMRQLSDARLVPALLAIFPTAHLAYGMGTIWGILRRRTPAS